MSINAQTLFTLLEKEMGREALSHAMFSFLSSGSATLKDVPSVSQPSVKAAEPAEEKPKKKAKAKKDPDAPKRPASDWCLFVKRCAEVMKASPIEGSKVKSMAVASALYDKDAVDIYKTILDDQILAAYKKLSLEAPVEPSAEKPKGKSKASSDGNETDTSTSSFTTADGQEKKKKQWSAEAKASAAAKRALTKQKKAAALKEETKTFSEEEIQNFNPQQIDGKTFLVNGRGDALTEDMEWAGHWNGSTLDKSATQPADLDV